MIATNINAYTNTIVIVKVYNNVNENDARYLYIYMKCAYFIYNVEFYVIDMDDLPID